MESTGIPKFAQRAVKDFDAAYELGRRSYRSIAPLVASMIKSNSAKETFWLKRLTGINRSPGSALEINNKSFEVFAEVPLQSIVDGEHGMHARQIESIGRQTSMLYDRVLADLIRDNGIGFDGVPFFHPEHPVNVDHIEAGVYSNVTDAGLGDWESVKSAVGSYPGNDGKPLGMVPTVALVPAQLEHEAVIEFSSRYNLTPDRSHPIGTEPPEVVVCPLLDDGNHWYAIARAQQTGAFIVQERDDPEPVIDQRDWKLIYGSRARGNAAYGMPFMIMKCRAR